MIFAESLPREPGGAVPLLGRRAAPGCPQSAVATPPPVVRHPLAAAISRADRQVRSASSGRPAYSCTRATSPVARAWPCGVAEPAIGTGRRSATPAAPRPTGPRRSARRRSGRAAGPRRALSSRASRTLQRPPVPVGGPLPVAQLGVVTAQRLQGPAGGRRILHRTGRLQRLPVAGERVGRSGPTGRPGPRGCSNAAAFSCARPRRSATSSTSPCSVYRSGAAACCALVRQQRPGQRGHRPPVQGVQFTVGDGDPGRVEQCAVRRLRSLPPRRPRR